MLCPDRAGGGGHGGTGVSAVAISTKASGRGDDGGRRAERERRSRLRADRTLVISDTMSPFCGVGSIMFALVAIAQFSFDQTPGSWASSTAAALSSLVLAIGWVLLRGPVGPMLRQHSLGVGVGVAVMVGLNPLVYVIGTKITYPAIGVLLVIVGVGALLHDRFWATAVIIAINVAWIACAFAFGIPVSPAIFASQLVKADALAIVLNVARHRTMQRMEQAREEVHRLATTDELTGVANQRGFLEVGRSLTEAADEDPDLTVVYVDVDGLKLVNDLHGHSAGDALIQSVAEVLRRTFRPEDTVARVGGDEFAVLLVGGTPELAHDLTSRVNERLREAGISASIGIASSQAGVRVDLGELLGRADAAMYTAKSARKNGGS